MSRAQVNFSILLLAAFAGINCFTTSEVDFFKGVNFVGTAEIQENASCFSPLNTIHANSVSLVPFCYGNSKTGEITTETNWQWWGETQNGVKSLIKHAHSKGLKVMVKPQIWFNHGTFTGNVSYSNEKAWNSFHSAYGAYILEYAKICQEYDVELFCIGTELGGVIKVHPEFWDQLITDIKEIYSGKLTYAGNWDNYSNIPFWGRLDYIGVDAYFPLSDLKTPSVQDVIDGWKEQIPALKSFSKKHKKQMVFVEFGYRSVDFSADKPWEYSWTEGVNLEAQKNCFEGTFKSIWKEDFFSGGFIWKWYPNHTKSGGKNDNRFTPQNKPSELVISTQFNN